ncbi:hypothetical protein HAX54_035689 [Datura stramonium]|uniref:Uncharacterized protein n=1 Tax=Datura stramonium TaxID=4076 RepID=A0ABS8SFK0_DATST|nr:hypothetical protein [Datura stramonium]
MQIVEAVLEVLFTGEDKEREGECGVFSDGFPVAEGRRRERDGFGGGAAAMMFGTVDMRATHWGVRLVLGRTVRGEESGGSGDLCASPEQL